MRWDTADDISNEVLDAVQEGLRHAHLSCGVELQRRNVALLSNLRDRLKRLREDSIAQSNEPYANAAFRAQMVTQATMDFLEMWVLLKEDKPREAWDKLIDAQVRFVIAQKIQFDPDASNLLKHLLAVERVVFPPQTFSSCGYTYNEAFCTICGCKYGECEHVAGHIYMGMICQKEIRKANLLEVSILEDLPKDKRCRVEEYADTGKVFCTLTRREVPQQEPVDPSQRFVRATAIRFD
jgi:hypothetical protein